MISFKLEKLNLKNFRVLLKDGLRRICGLKYRQLFKSLLGPSP